MAIATTHSQINFLNTHSFIMVEQTQLSIVRHNHFHLQMHHSFVQARLILAQLKKYVTMTN
jgi:hypothetical protein